MKPVVIQYSYKKQIGFTETQKTSLLKPESYGVNANQFIRQAIKEKIKKDWLKIKGKRKRIKTPF